MVFLEKMGTALSSLGQKSLNELFYGQKIISVRGIPVNSEYLSVTSHDGDRFYIQMNESDADQKPVLKNAIRTARPAGLCGVPYAQLLEQATIESSKLLQVGNKQLNLFLELLLSCEKCS